MLEKKRMEWKEVERERENSYISLPSNRTLSIMNYRMYTSLGHSPNWLKGDSADTITT